MLNRFFIFGGYKSTQAIVRTENVNSCCLTTNRKSINLNKLTSPLICNEGLLVECSLPMLRPQQGCYSVNHTTTNMFTKPDKERLDGEWVRIELLNPQLHGDDLFQMANDLNDSDTIFEFMSFGPFNDKAEFNIWIEQQAKLSDRLIYSIYSKRLRKYVGMYSIINIDVLNGKAELGSIWYGKCAQRTEINTETSYKMLCYLFEDLKYRRVEWKCDNRNSSSKKAALRLGFEYEGLFRKHMIVKDRNRDTAWFSIIDDEWPMRKENIKNNILRVFQE